MSVSDDYDPDDHGHSLEDVCDRLDNIESAVKETRSGVIESVVGVIIVLAVIAWMPDLWHGKIRYSLQYSVNYDQVMIDKEPADCNFFHAPLGGKGCDYERQLTVIRTRIDGRDPTRHEISFDDGKTWTVDDAVPPTEPQVLISWQKVED